MVAWRPPTASSSSFFVLTPRGNPQVCLAYSAFGPYRTRWAEIAYPPRLEMRWEIEQHAPFGLIRSRALGGGYFLASDASLPPAPAPCAPGPRMNITAPAVARAAAAAAAAPCTTGDPYVENIKTGFLVAISAVAAISEGLALTGRVQGNSILQVVRDIVVAMARRLDNSTTQKPPAPTTDSTPEMTALP
eukprot:tig00000681_g3078.t1